MATEQKALRKNGDLILAFIVFVFMFSVYVYTAAPSVYDGDSGEISAAVSSLGLAHPTGFPLYILTGKIFTLFIPIKDVAYRLNIFSALLVSLSIVFLFLTLRNFEITRLPALAASLIFGFGSSTWSHAGAGRVYGLNILMASILFFLFSKWLKEKDKKFIYCYSLILGVGFGAHALIILMALPLLFMMLHKKPFVDKKVLLLFLLPFAQYLYLPISYTRNTIATFGEAGSIGQFLHYITQRDFAFKIATRTLTSFQEFLSKIGSLFVSEFSILAFLIALVGLWVLKKKNKKLLFMILIIILGNIFMMYFYGNSGDDNILFRYFFTSYLAFSFLIAFGLENIFVQIKKIRYGTAVALFSVLILLLPLLPLRGNFEKNNRLQNYIISDFAENILKTADDDSILISEGDAVTGPLWYSYAEGERNDVVLIDRNALDWDWYIRNLNKKYPDIVNINYLKLDGSKRLERLVTDNFNKRSIFLTFFDEQIYKNFPKEIQFIPMGITYKAVGQNWKNAEFVRKENKRLWENYALRNLKASVYEQSWWADLAVRDYAVALNNLGSYYIQNRFLDEAKNVLRRSIDMHPIIRPLAQENLKIIEQLENQKR